MCTTYALALLPSRDVKHSQTMTNILQVPCAKNAFMQGLVSGVGVGFIRGTTAGAWPLISCDYSHQDFCSSNCCWALGNNDLRWNIWRVLVRQIHLISLLTAYLRLIQVYLPPPHGKGARKGHSNDREHPKTHCEARRIYIINNSKSIFNSTQTPKRPCPTSPQARHRPDKMMRFTIQP